MLNKKIKFKGNIINYTTIFLDNFLLEIIIIYKKISYLLFKTFTGKYNFLKKNKFLINIFKGEKVFILGNGPSLNNFQLKNLQNKNIITVNRFFINEYFKILKPKFHIFIDKKISNGIWPISYIDDVLKYNPEGNLILNSEWYHLDKFSKYKNNKNIYWVKINQMSLFFNKFENDLTKIISVGGGVIECAITISTYLGSKDINIAGVEGNGISRLMCGQNSHFSGKDPDYNNHSSLDFANDMISSSRSIRHWYKISLLLRNRNINIYNLTKEGILDAYEYKSYDIATK